MNNIDLQHLLYSTMPNIVIGFHGCDQKVFEAILYEHQPFKPSQNDYDWLGNGMYFWEQNLERAWEWANELADNPKSSVKKPAVIGAIIDLGVCLNLLDSANIQMLKKQYDVFKLKMRISKQPIKLNKNVGTNQDLLLRYLDCAVIESLHEDREIRDAKKFPPFDSVRGVFLEGDPIYETSGFREKSHIQICVRNPNCIKGFFAPKERNMSWRNP